MLVQMQDWSFIFDMKTHLLIRKQEQTKSSIVSHPHDGVQYLTQRKKDSKDLYKYFVDGSSVCVCENYNKRLQD